jgi:hypothetical protein
LSRECIGRVCLQTRPRLSSPFVGAVPVPLESSQRRFLANLSRGPKTATAGPLSLRACLLCWLERTCVRSRAKKTHKLSELVDRRLFQLEFRASPRTRAPNPRGPRARGQRGIVPVGEHRSRAEPAPKCQLRSGPRPKRACRAPNKCCASKTREVRSWATKTTCPDFRRGNHETSNHGCGPRHFERAQPSSRPSGMTGRPSGSSGQSATDSRALGAMFGMGTTHAGPGLEGFESEGLGSGRFGPVNGRGGAGAEPPEDALDGGRSVSVVLGVQLASKAIPPSETKRAPPSVVRM